MIQDKVYKTRMVMVNTDTVGPKERLNNPDGFHPMIRTSWPGTDQLRSALGYYYTVYQSSKGATLLNYATIMRQLAAGQSPGYYDHAGAPGGRLQPHRVRNQLYNIALGIAPGSQLGIGLFGNDLKREQLYSPVFELRGDINEWNAFENKDTAAQGWLEGEKFKSFIMGSYTAGSTSFTGLLNTIMSSSAMGAPATITHDYTAIVYSLSSDKAMRAASGMMLDVSGEYNYYADTTPNYETVVGQPAVTENMLPNAYIMYSELQNTGSLLLANYHESALDIPTQGPGYFRQSAQTQGGVTERNTVEAYQLWASGLESPAEPGAPSFSPMIENNTNFVILHSDEALTNSEYIKNEMIPYCTVITIPPDADASTGIRAPANMLLNIANDKDTKGFIDVLQMACINRLVQRGPWRFPPTPQITTTTKTPLSPTDGSSFQLATTYDPVEVLCDVNTELGAYLEELEKPGVIDPSNTMFGFALESINQYGAPASSLADVPYRFLKDYGRNGYNPDVPIQAKEEDISNAYVDLSSSLQAWSRTYPEILNGTGCHTDTLMYVVSKYLINEDGSQPTTPVQTFYISNKLDYQNLGANESIPITFYDSQVKYERKYRYVFHKMVAIIGNEYYYEPADRLLPAESAALTAALKYRIRAKNKPNIKVVMVPYVPGGVDCRVIDRPPVPPDVSFYLHKGISKRLQILLNANTGRYDLEPIAILSTDGAFFEKEYLAQTGESLSFEQIREQKKKITFSSDDPVDAYQLFRLKDPPLSYASFVDARIHSEDLNPTYGVGASYVDTLVPNTKYYYCARSVDIHGNLSNPTTIIEVEVVDNEGKIYLKHKPYSFPTAKQRLIKSGRRFILIEPSSQQRTYDQGNNPSNAGVEATPTKLLGSATLEDSVWNKEFKIRVTSKQTGRKIDLNINFKNSGIVKGS
tara:strand:- start:4617 stop:7388 length:2772 start_codon:yes stop_codon:yes gene_type:complete